ncbi:DJ-1/PfpI family protein [Sphingobacterium spiritivorum ATCC 33300]|uniref:DJ-1/PfpI family protein n=1 Tax=Sphingobacterium spiritivorum ATCC 33300 TaxID=525372 RepID=C2G3V0_SPHSI|nr:glyoxalase III HchA [Sphingobacterium spiritivorum]EEI90305.1 DJ-1/PfpI family protein [Sphingobacterium spiritivorum ATCC 33300]QQS95072.1 protein deglycase HchA [Sphingobacterium spiritivorum]
MTQELSKDPVFDGTGYEPSAFSRAMFVTPKTDYDHTVYENANSNKNKKILVVCTEERYMEMKNGKKFSTGNHPVETLVPLLHLEAAGFEADIYTATGKPVALEMWAMPSEDKAVKEILVRYEDQLDKPKSLRKFVTDNMETSVEYVAVFIPGGHGAMLGLPENEDLKKIINWSIDKDIFMLAICHGPAALLAASVKESPEDFPYKGYQINSFPDEIDTKTPEIGYVPGEMPWFYGAKLEALGIEILNTDISGACHVDRKLITGDSPLAANAFGKVSAKALLKK